MKVQANFDYNDKVLKRLVKQDEIIEVTEERAEVLMKSHFKGIPFVNVVEEPTVEEVEEPTVEETPKRRKKK